MRSALTASGVFILSFLFLGGCASEAPFAKQVTQEQKIMTPEELTHDASARFNRARAEGAKKEEAVKRVVEFLKAQRNVKDVKVTGSDTLRVFFTDGNDLLLMLGRDRL